MSVSILRIRFLAGSYLLDGQHLAADQHDVAEPSQAAEEQAELLQDEIEALSLGHGGSSGGGRPFA